MFALIVFVMLLSSSSLLSFQARLPLKSYYWVLQFVSLIIASCVAYSVGQFVTKKKKSTLIYCGLLLIFAPITLLLFIQGTNTLSAMRVHSLSSTSSIQGDYISINGHNFGDAWEAGTVTVGGTNFIIVRWENEKVVIKQPVTEPVDNAVLRICNAQDICDEYKYFTILDPSTL